MMEEFPSNSRRPVPNPNGGEPAEKKPLEKVVSGVVSRRKKPLGQRIKDTFFEGDPKSVVTAVILEVLIPALKDLGADMFNQGIDRLIYGESRSPSHSRGIRTSGPLGQTRISYDRYAASSRPTPATSTTPTHRAPQRQTSSINIGEIYMQDKFDAELVLEKLCESVEQYGSVTVAELYTLNGWTPVYTDNKFGWTNLSTARIDRVRDGYLLILPEPEEIK